jgi:hypothetical protein
MSDHETPEGGLGGPADAADDPATAAVMRTIAPALRDPALWAEPPASLADSIVAAIAAERDASPPAPSDSPLAPVVPLAPAAPVDLPPAAGTDELAQARVRREERRRRPVLWAALASAAAVLAIAVGFVAMRGEDEDPAEFAMAGTDLALEASASGDINELDAGVAIKLDVEGLPPAPEGQYYAGWVRSADGQLVGIGSFHMRGGDSTVTLWSGVPLAQYPTITVTIQTEGAGEASSGQVVMRGSLED